jgi:hypothetical protein
MAIWEVRFVAEMTNGSRGFVNLPLSGTVEDVRTDVQRERDVGSQCAQRGFADSGVACFGESSPSLPQEEILSRFIFLHNHVTCIKRSLSFPQEKAMEQSILNNVLLCRFLNKLR